MKQIPTAARSGNLILPNTFQTPNFFVDDLMALLTAEETAVLFFATRQILGFAGHIRERSDNISLSQFSAGITNSAGQQVSRGCGLGVAAISKALAALHKYKILMKIGGPDMNGQRYWLQDDSTNIDWLGLEDRQAAAAAAAAARTQRATAARSTKRATAGAAGALEPTEPIVGRNTPEMPAGPIVGRNEPLTSDDNTKPIETHIAAPNGADDRAASAPDQSIQIKIRFPNEQTKLLFESWVQQWRQPETNTEAAFWVYGNPKTQVKGLAYLAAQNVTPAMLGDVVTKLLKEGRITIKGPASIVSACITAAKRAGLTANHAPANQESLEELRARKRAELKRQREEAIR